MKFCSCISSHLLWSLSSGLQPSRERAREIERLSAVEKLPYLLNRQTTVVAIMNHFAPFVRMHNVHIAHFVRCLSTIWFSKFTPTGAWLQWNKTKNNTTAYQATLSDYAPSFMLNRFCRNRNYYRMHNQMLKTFLFDIISFLSCVCAFVWRKCGTDKHTPIYLRTADCGAIWCLPHGQNKPKSKCRGKNRNTDNLWSHRIHHCTRHFGRFFCPLFIVAGWIFLFLLLCLGLVTAKGTYIVPIAFLVSMW